MSYTVSYDDDGSDEYLEPIYSLYRSPRGTWIQNGPADDADSEYEDFITWIDSLSGEDDEDYPWDDDYEYDDGDFDEILEGYYLYAEDDCRWDA
jgi:hypothetical protein